jgi:hypothetical protein
MDTTQLLLTIVLLVTTVLLVVVGIQLIFVLKEVHKIIRKINGVVEGFEKIGGSVEHGFGELIGFISGIKTLFKVVDIVHSKKNGKSK